MAIEKFSQDVLSRESQASHDLTPTGRQIESISAEPSLDDDARRGSDVSVTQGAFGSIQQGSRDGESPEIDHALPLRGHSMEMEDFRIEATWMPIAHPRPLNEDTRQEAVTPFAEAEIVVHHHSTSQPQDSSEALLAQIAALQASVRQIIAC